MKLAEMFSHPWDLPPGQAVELQRQLQDRVKVTPSSEPVRWVAGVDVSVKGDRAQAAVVVLTFPELELVEAATHEQLVTFPYIPGLLAFREGPAVLAALAKLKMAPDLLIFDAQGLAHPRRMGLATHLGVLLDLPSIGCAKSRLCGNHTEPAAQKGSWVPLVDGEETIGVVLRTRDRVRPVYVSIGHRVDLEVSVRTVLACCTRYRLPEPTRWAHKVAGGLELELPQPSNVSADEGEIGY